MTSNKILFRYVSALAAVPILSLIGAAHGQEKDNAALFGALESIHDISLSPDGNRIAFIGPAPDRSRRLFIVDTVEGAVPRQILTSNGTESSLSWCGWVTNSRLACQAYARADRGGEIVGATRLFALDADGTNIRDLSNRLTHRSLYSDFRGGTVIDWSASDNGSLLMTRSYVPENELGTRMLSNAEGLGVDRVDSVSGKSKRVESPNRDAVHYLSDGQGSVRVMATQGSEGATGQIDSTVRYFSRPKAGGGWKPLTQYDLVTEQGFYPVAVDPATDSVIGFQSIDGRKAAVSMTLDGTGKTSTVYAHPEVDVDDIIRVGRNGRVVGISYVTDQREAVITDKGIASMTNALSKALGGRKILIQDASADESRYLVRASSDTDPGAYYLFNPTAKELRPLLLVREQLAETQLSMVKPVSYPAADGTMVPAYLTLPPGRSDAKGLPAIVLPHGGPSARDEWGFDWLAQYFAQTGYAVLQPNFRGSSGYGDQWFQNNGFQSWRTALGDIADGGRWLISAQAADPGKLSIVGWSYGGYAALQSGATTPGLFKAIVAIAPVTDLAQLKLSAAASGRLHIDAKFLGSGPHIREGSPAQNAGSIDAPVLMFHGSFDQNVDIIQSRMMQRALKDKAKRVELIEYPELAHGLETSEARTDMLRKISAFLPK